MGYFNKEKGTISICESIEMGYIKNKDGRTTNPYLWLHGTMNLKTNKISKVFYSVTAFNEKETLGYHRSQHKTYDNAKAAYDKLFVYHTK